MGIVAAVLAHREFSKVALARHKQDFCGGNGTLWLGYMRLPKN